jgi:trimeric autotransporter adhesin
MIRARGLLLLSAAGLLAGAPLPAQSDTLLSLASTGGDRLVVDSAGGIVAYGTLDTGAIPASGPGVRMMWYPGKAAFRAGSAGSHWNDASVGTYSTATGYETKASGTSSTAMGASTTASGFASTAMGASTTASGSSSTAMGASTTASGDRSTAMGNITTASGWYSTAMGASTTASGHYSTAMGHRVSTNGQEGSFVYGDNSTITVMNATVANQFSVRAAGGVRFFTNSGLTAGATLAPGGGSWSAVSDRARKEHVLAVDGEEVLARIRTLPLATWRYIAEEDRSVRHMGPMAQDWHRAFGFSSDSLTINSGDLDGVNLAGVQALDARTEALRGENERLRGRVDALDAENAALRARLDAIERRLGAPPGRT